MQTYRISVVDDDSLELLGLFGLTTCEGMDADPPSDPCER